MVDSVKWRGHKQHQRDERDVTLLYLLGTPPCNTLLSHGHTVYLHGFASGCSQCGSQGPKTAEKLSLVSELDPLCHLLSASVTPLSLPYISAPSHFYINCYNFNPVYRIKQKLQNTSDQAIPQWEVSNKNKCLHTHTSPILPPHGFPSFTTGCCSGGEISLVLATSLCDLWAKAWSWDK